MYTVFGVIYNTNIFFKFPCFLISHLPPYFYFHLPSALILLFLKKEEILNNLYCSAGSVNTAINTRTSCLVLFVSSGPWSQPESLPLFVGLSPHLSKTSFQENPNTGETPDQMVHDCRTLLLTTSFGWSAGRYLPRLKN